MFVMYDIFMANMYTTAKKLSALYGENFGGKAAGRYRISYKLVKDMAGRRRLYADDIQMLTRAMLEEGFILVDMDTFFVILSANSFVNYRRANADAFLNV